MARQKSDEKREAILNAAIMVIDAQGLGAATAKIAAAAGVSAGSLFTYFATKSELLNQLYLRIKSDMVADLMQDVPSEGDFQTILRKAWGNWMDWGMAHPAKRHVLAQLMVSDEITAQTRSHADAAMGDLSALIARIRCHGPLRDVPEAFALRLVSSVVEACIDASAADPSAAPALREAGFQSFWRMVG